MEGIEVRNLEVTNRGRRAGGASRRPRFPGQLRNGPSTSSSAGLYIHDVNGTNEKKDNGGIIFRTNGNTKPSRFDGLLIERNIIWQVDRSAIAAQSYHFPRTRWYPSLNVVIRDNLVDDIGGDGIVPWATDGAVIEHNIARNCNARAGSYNAGIWPWSTDNSLFQLNSAPSPAPPSTDRASIPISIPAIHFSQYNYSHDNEGGFLLICTPGKRNASGESRQSRHIARYNISRNDKERIFHLSAAENTLVHDNAIYVPAGSEVQILLVSDWSGWPEGAVFRSNAFYVEGTATTAMQVSRE